MTPEATITINKPIGVIGSYTEAVYSYWTTHNDEIVVTHNNEGLTW